MVLKAKVADNFSYFYVDGVVYRYEGIVTIPEEYNEEFDVSECVDVENCSTYLKDMSPDKGIDEKPLVDFVVEDSGWICSDGKGYCKKSILRSSTGTWVICRNNVVYTYKKEIRVLKRGNCRHRKDFECEELRIDLKTGNCQVTQKFFDKNMVTLRYVFNKDTREWILKDRSVDQDILGARQN